MIDGATNNKGMTRDLRTRRPRSGGGGQSADGVVRCRVPAILTGVTVNMSLKSGTNQLHGQTYYFNQNPAVTPTSFS